MEDRELKELQEELKRIFGQMKRPKRGLVTAGMPYANGPLHIGHLAGAHIPADVYSRWLRLVLGSEKVLFVCGSDDHGSASEVAAKVKGVSTQDFVQEVHQGQSATLQRYSIGLDVYAGTSKENTFEVHKDLCQEFLRKLHHNGLLVKRSSEQWYDSQLMMFLPDRYVYGECPNEKCENKKAYSEECDECGITYEPRELRNPRSSVSDSIPVLKETTHWWLNMWAVTDQLKQWLESRQKIWRKGVFLEAYNTVLPSISFANIHEETFKRLKEHLPKHKSRYAPGKRIIVQFEGLKDLDLGRDLLTKGGVESQLEDRWAYRSMTRDVAWGVPVPEDLDEEMVGKALYVWPESLIAPISFTKMALKSKGLDPNQYKEYWTDPDARVFQFLGQDNVFFYVLMQGAMWLGTQKDPYRMPISGEWQLTDVYGNFHLQIGGQKMSKSKGTFYLADQLIGEMGYDPDQVRYFLSILSLSEKNSNFDFDNFNERNAFLAGPLNAAFEKPISACHSKFDGEVPEGQLIGKTKIETAKIVQNYIRMMERAEFSKILFLIENYARLINGLFTQFKPHDDRFDLEQRKNALFSCFYILKNIMIMLHPFVPATMARLRKSLNLPDSVLRIEELAHPIPSGHKIGEQLQYFPAVSENESKTSF